MDAYDLDLIQGITFTRTLRWVTDPLVYKPITGITVQGSPFITAIAHGAPDGAEMAVVGVLGMTELNAANWPLRASDWHKATVHGVDTIELNDVLAAGFKPYTSGGYVVYRTPADLSAVTAQLVIKDKPGGTVLLTLDSALGDIVIDTVLKTVTYTFAATINTPVVWRKGVYELELTDGSGVVTLLGAGDVTFTID